MQTTAVDYYSVLGVSTKASDSDIKQKYRELSKKYHPDTIGGDTKRMSLINEAYAVLSNPLKRRQYEPPKPKTAETPPTYQQKSPTQSRQRAATKQKAQVIEEEPENMWYVFFSYVLAVPVAILIVGVGFPFVQRMLPKAEAVSGTATQTTTQSSSSSNATTTQQVPNTSTSTTTQSTPTLTPTEPTTTTPSDTQSTQTKKKNSRSNFYYEKRNQQSQQSNNNYR